MNHWFPWVILVWVSSWYQSRTNPVRFPCDFERIWGLPRGIGSRRSCWGCCAACADRPSWVRRGAAQSRSCLCWVLVLFFWSSVLYYPATSVHLLDTDAGIWHWCAWVFDWTEAKFIFSVTFHPGLPKVHHAAAALCLVTDLYILCLSCLCAFVKGCASTSNCHRFWYLYVNAKDKSSY
jgi:hypothetical protein